MRWKLVIGAAVCLAAGLSAAPMVWAQEGAAARDDDASDVLAGPSAETGAPPSAASVFAPGMRGAMGGGMRARADRWMFEILRSMNRGTPEAEAADAAGMRVPTEVWLSGEQVEAMREAVAAHEERQRAWRREHREELRRLREAGGLAGDERVEEPDEDQRAARQALQRLRQTAPTTDRVRGEVWALMSDAQRAFVERELERRGEAYEREQMGMMGGALDEGMGAYASDEAELERAFERIRALPAAQRRWIVERIHGRLDQMARDAREHEAREEAPTMDEGGVDVPTTRGGAG